MYGVCPTVTTGNVQESVDIAINWSVESDMCSNSDKAKMLMTFL